MLKSIDDITGENLREGNYKVFETLYKHYYSKLCAYANSYASDSQIAENAVQDTFLALWTNRKKTIITTSIKSYLYRVVYNRIMDEYRKDTNRNKKLLDYYQTALQRGIDADDSYIEKRLIALHECIDKLPTKCKITFKEKKLAEKKYAQIATEMNVSIKTVEAHMTRAFKLLKKCLEKDSKVLSDM